MATVTDVIDVSQLAALCVTPSFLFFFNLMSSLGMVIGWLFLGVSCPFSMR
jgi:hypothetical protein